MGFLPADPYFRTVSAVNALTYRTVTPFFIIFQISLSVSRKINLELTV